MRDEMARRFGDDASVLYHRADDETVVLERVDLLSEIDKRGLLYPVTVLDGVPLYDGAVSYPAIMRAVANKLADRETAV